MERLIFVDSNIWCYYFDRSDQEHDAVSERLEQAMALERQRNPALARENGQRALSPGREHKSDSIT